MIQTTSPALASKALSALNAHEAFPAVAQRFSSPKIRNVAEAEDHGVERHNLEGAAAKAVFSAHPGRFYGPVKSGRDFYVFEVVKIAPAEERTLADVEREEGATFNANVRKEALARFLIGWRARWKARTICKPGFLIPKCSEYHGPEKVADPYTFS